MGGEIRRPLFLGALVAWLVVVLVEVGASVLPVPPLTVGELRAALERDQPDEPPPGPAELAEMVRARNDQPPRPGYAITAQAGLDGVAVLIGLAWMGAGLVWPRATGRVQGVASLVISLIAIFAGVTVAMLLFALLMVMIGLFLAVPFGTLAYLAIWGFFARGPAAATLGLVLALKLVGAALLVVAQPRFLQNTRLVVLVGLSLLLTVLISLLHAFPPGILVSITDVLAALIVVIVALVAGYKIIPNSKDPNPPALDPLGALLSIVGLVRGRDSNQAHAPFSGP